jgi:drug/metabolite transporter (DMT)-like permease
VVKAYTIVAIVLIVLGILGLVYGQFSYNEESEGARLGPIELTITEKKTVDIPTWAGAGAIVVGAAMLAYPLLRRGGV